MPHANVPKLDMHPIAGWHILYSVLLPALSAADMIHPWMRYSTKCFTVHHEFLRSHR